MARLLLTLLVCLFSTPVGARDNFLILIGDDLGVDGIGVYSRDDLYDHPGEGATPGPTPNIDQLALEGILFRNAYAMPICTATRAATLTGRHGFRTEIGSLGAVLDLAETTLPEMLAASHSNAALGKWHLGGQDVDHPIDSGFDYYAGGLGGGVGDYESWNKTRNSMSTTGSTQSGFTTYATTDAVNEAIAKIAEFGEEPWFVWVAFNAPHSPFHVPPDTLTTIDVNDSSSNALKYDAAVEAMDTEIGRLLASIPASILADTTIVFIGDNGTPNGVVEAPFISGRAKGRVYEGGINVPFIVKGPRIDPADEGSESLALVTVTDLFASVAEIASVSAAAEDSVSIVPYLEDPSLGTLRSCAYSEQFSPNGSGPYTNERRAARDERYKLIWRDGVYEEFFDLDPAEDPFEQNNLLPVSNLSTEELAAYDALEAAMENRTCAEVQGSSVPALGRWGAFVLIALLSLRGVRELVRLGR
jgi:arylsulfatase A-like enzyme